MVEEDEYGKLLTKKEKTALKRTAEKAVEAAVATEGERMTAEVRNLLTSCALEPKLETVQCHLSTQPHALITRCSIPSVSSGQ